MALTQGDAIDSMCPDTTYAPVMRRERELSLEVDNSLSPVRYSVRRYLPSRDLRCDREGNAQPGWIWYRERVQGAGAPATGHGCQR